MNTSTLTDFNSAYTHALKQFKAASTPFAECILTLTRTVYDARMTLPERDYILFLRHSKLDGRSEAAKNRLKRYITIGKAAPRLLPHADALPASLSALRHLVRLSSDALTAAVQDGSVSSDMTTDDAKHLIISNKRTDGTQTKLSKRVPNYSVTLEFFNAQFDVRHAKSLLKTLQTFIAKHGEDMGLVPDIKTSVDLDLALMTDERQSAA